MNIGYARVSTPSQKIDLQKDALLDAGCERIYEDQMSGLRKDRTGLQQALEQLRQGDTFVIWKLDRLGRSVKDLILFVESLAKRNINFKSIMDNIDTSSPMGMFFFHIMASLAQMERELVVDRTRAGLEAAKKRGRVGGRRRRMTDSKIESAKRLLANGIPPREVADNLCVSIPTLYRWIPASTIDT